MFSGRFQQGYPNAKGVTVGDKNVANLITDFNLDGTPTKNVIFNQQEFNMGGCMGCHGNAQVNVGSDFSFILGDASQNIAPDVTGPGTPTDVEKYLRLLVDP